MFYVQILVGESCLGKAGMDKPDLKPNQPEGNAWIDGEQHG